MRSFTERVKRDQERQGLYVFKVLKGIRPLERESIDLICMKNGVLWKVRKMKNKQIFDIEKALDEKRAMQKNFIREHNYPSSVWTLVIEHLERIKGKGKWKMQISKEEMETILLMYRVVKAEGQESDTMRYLTERIKKEKRKWKKFEMRS